MLKQKTVKVGDKVKVYNVRAALYGEVIGIRKNGVLVLNYRPDFKDLPVSSFDHFRESNHVVFLNLPEEPEPVKPPKRKVAITGGGYSWMRVTSFADYQKLKEVNHG